MTIHETELHLIRQIQFIRTPLLDQFFLLCNYLDKKYFIVGLVLLVFLAGKRRIGCKMAIVFLLSYLANKTLKYTFGLPRPSHIDPTLGLLTIRNPGFPSGAAQTAVIILGIILYEWKSKWKWLIGPLFALVLSFSRLYLGVHFPTDLLGGWIVGGFLLWIYLQLDRFKWIKELKG